ncbi:MAG TPA: galactokinase family protein, partial [Thermoleophilaceae bacterium]|nr:galactokinase family protein [Thermoleophilaceae bacterium]
PCSSWAGTAGVPAERVAAHGPGRVNVIGEHTDYNDGLCLPFAIGRGVTVTGEPLFGWRIEAVAADIGEEDSFEPRGIMPKPGWRAFVRGVAAELQAAGSPLRGTRLEIAGDLPRGAGLGSSAAMCVALALTLLGREPPDRRELARLCSQVERRWAGADTGLLDQLAVLLAEADHALRLDLRDLSATPVPVELGDWTLAVLDSGAGREHSASGYNERRAECRAACDQLGLPSLRSAAAEDVARLPAPLDARVRHVVSENGRVEEAVSALQTGDLEWLGRLLDASHASLREDYEVSTPEVERAVEACREAGAAGARVMGGGFGGSVLALYPPGAEPVPGSLTVEPGPAARLI